MLEMRLHRRIADMRQEFLRRGVELRSADLSDVFQHMIRLVGEIGPVHSQQRRHVNHLVLRIEFHGVLEELLSQLGHLLVDVKRVGENGQRRRAGTCQEQGERYVWLRFVEGVLATRIVGREGHVQTQRTQYHRFRRRIS